MANIEKSDGKQQLIFILEYASVIGGMLHSVLSLINQIHQVFEIVIICPEGELAELMKTKKIKVITIGRSNDWQSKRFFKRTKLLLSLFTTIKKVTQSNSIVITNNIYSQLLVSICSYFIKFKLIYFNRGGDLSNSISKLVILLSSHLNLVITTSANQKSIVDASALTRKGAKCLVLSNPVEKIAQTSWHMENEKCFSIGIVGYIDEGKNQLLAVEALSKLIQNNYNLRLYIYGEANNRAYLQLLHNKINELNISEYVTFEGFTKNKSEIYSKIDLLLSTSVSEGFGRTLVEAMLAKKPVVALHTAGGPKDIIVSDKYGLLVDNNIDSVAGAIERFLTDSCYKESVIKHAYDFASYTFAPEAIASKFITIIKDEVL